tara:strand:+ start:1102 stop:1257 length:156 start_codon:yes stop_codon:yes gene_type:complete
MINDQLLTGGSRALSTFLVFGILNFATYYLERTINHRLQTGGSRDKGKQST